MLLETPRTRSWMLPAICAGVMVFASREAIAASLPRLGALLMFVAALFAAAAAVNALYWLAYTVTGQIRQVIAARAETEAVLWLRAWGQLTEYQVHGYEVLQPTVVTLPGSAGPVNLLLRVSGAEIPYDFVTEFFAQSAGAYLIPVGTYAEGTKQRGWAVSLTAHLIRQGFAERANGNHSARWSPGGYDAARRWVNLDRMREITEDK